MSDCVLGRNTRMLACHSRDRTQAGFHLDKDLKSTMAVYYRALLKDLCTKFYPTVLDRDGRDLRVGKIYSKIEKSNTPFIGIVCLYQFSVWCPQPINRIVKNLRRKLSKDYCRLAFNKMKIPDHTTTISDSHLTEYFDKMNEEGHLEKIRQFEALRECYSAGPETLIVLDKLEYFRESKKFENINLIQLFDPVKSPRAYAYVAY